MQQSFDQAKQALINNIAYFKLNWKTQVTVDASPVGLGAVLSQYNPEDPRERHIVMYISRSLSLCERKYSQIEKEALSVVWACEWLELYLLGCDEFELICDNKAVTLIISNPLSKQPARIQRWELQFSQYRFKIVHRPGLGNKADFLSRHPVADLACDDDGEIMENYIHFIINGNIPPRVSKEEILRETLSDRTLSAITSMVKSSQFVDDESVRPYKHVFNDLSISLEGFVLRNDRLVVPASLQTKMIDLAHEDHLGIEKTKKLLRSKLWFPGMVERKTKFCLACQATIPGGHFTPLCMSEMRHFEPSAINLNVAVSDAVRKAKIKAHRDADLHVRLLDLKPRDQVLVQQNRSSKSVACFDHVPYIVVEIRNNMVIAQRGHHLITRNKFRKFVNPNPLVPTLIFVFEWFYFQ